MKRGIRLGYIVVGLLFLTLALPCVSTEYAYASDTPKRAGTINVGLNTDVTSLDPHYSGASST